MREKIIFIDFLIMTILSLLIISDLLLLFIFHKVVGIYYLDYLFLGIILFYYSIIKSIFGIIIFIKNIIQKNISVMSKRILFLFIPLLILIIYIGNFLFDRLLHGWYIGLERTMASIILIIGCLTLLCYYLLNKALNIKIFYKIILAIILPFSYFFGYWTTWIIILT